MAPGRGRRDGPQALGTRSVPRWRTTNASIVMSATRWTRAISGGSSPTLAVQRGDPARRRPFGGRGRHAPHDDGDGEHPLVGTEVLGGEGAGEEHRDAETEAHAHRSYRDAVGGGPGERSRHPHTAHLVNWFPAPKQDAFADGLRSAARSRPPWRNAGQLGTKLLPALASLSATSNHTWSDASTSASSNCSSRVSRSSCW